MICDLHDLDTAYMEFLKQHNQSSDLSGVEYIGLNFSNTDHIPMVFKAYYCTSRSMAGLPDFLRPFQDRGMIHGLNKIDDTVNKGYIRYEIGLANRTNENMLWVYDWISQIYPDINRYGELIEKMTRIKCCVSPHYRYAAMYFLGIIADLKKGTPPAAEAVKLHYLLRMCEDPDKIGKNYSLMTTEYISVLRGLHSPEFSKIMDVVEELLDKTPAELWMAAVDFFRSGEVKYKLYIRKISPGLYGCLMPIMNRMNLFGLSSQVRIYEEWIRFHPELERYGLAVCLTGKGQWSLNFYH